MKAISKNKLTAHLKKLYDEHDKVSKSIIQNADGPSYTTYRNKFGSLNEAKIASGLMNTDLSVMCEDCGVHYQNVSKHWTQSECSQNSISQKKKEILVGHMMGDATLGNRHIPSPYIAWNMVNKEYMEWLDERLGWLSNGVKIKHEKEEARQIAKDKDFIDVTEESKFSTLYVSKTVGHKEFNKLDWQTSSGKVFPNGIKLTPTVVKIWYCDDGGLDWQSHYANGRAVITATSQEEQMNMLASKFNSVGFNPSISYNGELIRFSTDETKELLQWMGKPPDGMEYKWENTDYDSYKSKKENK